MNKRSISIINLSIIIILMATTIAQADFMDGDGINIEPYPSGISIDGGQSVTLSITHNWTSRQPSFYQNFSTNVSGDWAIIFSTFIYNGDVSEGVISNNETFYYYEEGEVAYVTLNYTSDLFQEYGQEYYWSSNVSFGEYDPEEGPGSWVLLSTYEDIFSFTTNSGPSEPSPRPTTPPSGGAVDYRLEVTVIKDSLPVAEKRVRVSSESITLTSNTNINGIASFYVQEGRYEVSVDNKLEEVLVQGATSRTIYLDDTIIPEEDDEESSFPWLLIILLLAALIIFIRKR